MSAKAPWKPGPGYHVGLELKTVSVQKQKAHLLTVEVLSTSEDSPCEVGRENHVLISTSTVAPTLRATLGLA